MFAQYFCRLQLKYLDDNSTRTDGCVQQKISIASMFYLPIRKKYDNECKSWRLHVLCAIFHQNTQLCNLLVLFCVFLCLLWYSDFRIICLFISYIAYSFYFGCALSWLIRSFLSAPHRSPYLNSRMFLQGPLLDAGKVEGITKCNWYLPFANEEDTKVRLLVASQSSLSAQQLGRYWKYI